MNFDFSDEQKELSSHLRKMLMSKCSLKEARRCLEQEQSYSHEVWSQLAKMGLLGTAIPTSYGGAGAGYLELCLVAEELGRVLAPVPSVSTIYLATELIKEVASSEQREKLLPEIANGSLIFAVAICDADSGEPAYFNKERGTLSGLKAPVEDSLMADHAIVYAKSQEGDSLVLIDLQDTTVASTGSRSIDPTKPQGKLHFHDTPGEPLGRLGGGTNALQRARDRAAILLAFEQLGAADRALEISIEYATQRKAFGRLIGSYQAIKHKLANVYVQNQLARVHAYFGAWAMQTGDADLRSAAGTARIAAINAFQFAAQEMLQVHGGIGFTWESDCQLFYRRAQHTALSLGAASSWRAQVVEKLRRD